MSHEELVEQIPLAALDALPAEETRAIREHCAAHPPCGALLADYEQVAAALAAGVPVRPLPPQIEQRLRARIGGAPRGFFPFAWSRGLSPALAIAVLLLVVLAVLALWRFALPPADPDGAEMARLQQMPGAVKAAITGTDRAPGSAGQVLADPQSTVGYLLVNRLNVLPAGQVYQVWLIRSGMRDSGGTFTVDSAGSARVRLTAPLVFASYQDVGVTVEPAGGSPGPTTPRVIGGSFAR